MVNVWSSRVVSTARGKQRAGDPQADIVVTEVVRRVEPNGGAEVPRKVGPGTAAKDPGIASSGYPGRAVSGRAGVAVLVALLHPLPDIAVHLVEAPRVRLKHIDRHCLFTVLASCAAIV